ncbi:MAG TPA: hypothetical protein VM580_04565, partial [Labilithrix sp.]|nr:hypothetical protein [Labilithrix sp.]
SLIGPFFSLLGYDLTDPRECVPEYKADFGKSRSSKPIDWGFKIGGAFAFFVEAKEVGRKLVGFDEQLADYFAKDPSVKLGVLTNGSRDWTSAGPTSCVSASGLSARGATCDREGASRSARRSLPLPGYAHAA